MFVYYRALVHDLDPWNTRFGFFNTWDVYDNNFGECTRIGMLIVYCVTHYIKFLIMELCTNQFCEIENNLMYELFRLLLLVFYYKHFEILILLSSWGNMLGILFWFYSSKTWMWKLKGVPYFVCIDNAWCIWRIYFFKNLIKIGKTHYSILYQIEDTHY